MKPHRVLFVNGGIMSRGGIESYMMNYYRNINREKIQIDFIVHGFEKGVYDDEIKSLGGEIYNVPIKSKNYLGNISALRRIFRNKDYKIVHSHMDAMSYPVLKEAKKSNIPIRIAHSHNTKHLTNNKIKLRLNEYARGKINKYTTHQFACSVAAGRWLFGNECMDIGKVLIANNAVDMQKFQYDENARVSLRKKLKIDEKFVIGHVGRFDYQKNHTFLIDIFNEVVKSLQKDAVLLLVGTGHLEQEIRGKVKRLDLENNVIFLGSIDNVDEYLNAFDVLLLPSHFEGLPVTLIEAQVNSVKCIVSDVITKEVEISDRITFTSLNTTALEWANVILNESDYYTRWKTYEDMKFSNYNIKKQVDILEDFYLNALREI